MLEVRILPGEPKLFSFNQLQVWVERPAFDRMLGVCEVKLGLQVDEAETLLGTNPMSTTAAVIALMTLAAAGAARVAPPEFAI
jgi:hypothetical protein